MDRHVNNFSGVSGSLGISVDLVSLWFICCPCVSLVGFYTQNACADEWATVSKY